MGKVLMRPGGGSSDLDAITAKASDVLAGKAFVDPNGEIQSGTIPDFTTNKQGTAGGKTIQLFDNLEKDGDNLVLKVTDGMKTGYIKNTDVLGISGETAGNAVAKNVVVGNTFTSAAGVKLEGVLPNNSNSKRSDTIEVKQDVVLVRIPSGAYFNGADGKDPSIELSKLTVAKMATDMFGLSVITNFRLAQLYSNRVSMTWRLSPDERLSYDKSTFVDRNTKTRHGLCTGFKIDITAGGQSKTAIVPYNPNTSIYDYTSDIIPQGNVTVIITPFISLGLNEKLYGAMQQQSIVLNNINGSLSIADRGPTHAAQNDGQMTVPAGVRYMAYVMVGHGSNGSDGRLFTHNNYDDSYMGGGGGAGGKFKEGLIKVTPGETISYHLPVMMGYGGPGTIVVGNNRIVLTVEDAGYVPYYRNGNDGLNTPDAASGGSGGGAGASQNEGYRFGGKGGSDGSSGQSVQYGGTPGTGQGTTTRSKLTGILYAGGGGGGGTYYIRNGQPFVNNGGEGGGGAGGSADGSALNATIGLGAGGGGGGKYGANILYRGSRGAGNGSCGCIYLEWGDRVTETYKNEIMAMERG